MVLGQVSEPSVQVVAIHKMVLWLWASYFHLKPLIHVDQPFLFLCNFQINHHLLISFINLWINKENHVISLKHQDPISALSVYPFCSLHSLDFHWLCINLKVSGVRKKTAYYLKYCLKDHKHWITSFFFFPLGNKKKSTKGGYSLQPVAPGSWIDLHHFWMSGPFVISNLPPLQEFFMLTMRKTIIWSTHRPH